MRHAKDDDWSANMIRGIWTSLTANRLTAAARDRNWPVSTQAGFERVLLDNVYGAPWETIEHAADASACDLVHLILAIEMGARVLDGSASLPVLNRRSLAFRALRAAEPDRQDRCAEAPADAFVEQDVARLMKRAIGARSGVHRTNE
jgi:hypothetical protein